MYWFCFEYVGVDIVYEEEWFCVLDEDVVDVVIDQVFVDCGVVLCCFGNGEFCVDVVC